MFDNSATFDYSLIVGGSLKKMNTANNKWVLLGIMLPLIVFLLAMNIVYALFTASSRTLASDGNTTAAVKIGFSQETTLNNTPISSASGTITNLLPGDTITIAGAVENNGNASLYFIINFQLTITLSNTTTTLTNSNYTFNGNTLVVLDGETYTDATMLATNATKNFTLNYTLDPNYGNTYQGVTLGYNLSGYAIQTVGQTASGAATYLITNFAS